METGASSKFAELKISGPSPIRRSVNPVALRNHEGQPIAEIYGTWWSDLVGGGGKDAKQHQGWEHLGVNPDLQPGKTRSQLARRSDTAVLAVKASVDTRCPVKL